MREYDSRTIFIAIGICWIIIGFILITFMPAVILNLKYVSDEVFISLLPRWSIFTYGIVVFLIGSAALILGLFGIKRKFIISSILLFLLSFPVLYFATTSHETISVHGFEFQRPFTFELYQYTWENIEELHRHDIADGNEFDGYEIIFNDGTTYILNDDHRIMSGHQRFLSLVRSHGIEINYSP